MDLGEFFILALKWNETENISCDNKAKTGIIRLATASQGRLYFYYRQRPVMAMLVSVGSFNSREGGEGGASGLSVLFGQNINIQPSPSLPLPYNRHNHCLVFSLPYRLLQQVTGRGKIFGINFPIFHSILTVIDATV